MQRDSAAKIPSQHLEVVCPACGLSRPLMKTGAYMLRHRNTSRQVPLHQFDKPGRVRFNYVDPQTGPFLRIRENHGRGGGLVVVESFTMAEVVATGQFSDLVEELIAQLRRIQAVLGPETDGVPVPTVPTEIEQPKAITQPRGAKVTTREEILERLASGRPNKASADKALRDLANLDFDVSDAQSALDEYAELVRDDFADAEEYGTAREDAWGEFLDALDNLEEPEEEEE